MLRSAALAVGLVTGLLAVAWPYLPWASRPDGACPLVRFWGAGHPLISPGAGEIATRPPRCPHLQGYGSGGAGLPSPHDLRTSQPGGSSSNPSSLVLYSNATVWTGHADAPHAEAFLVDADTGRFAFVGDRQGALAAAAGWAQAPPREVDLQGAHVIPGKRIISQKRAACLLACLAQPPALLCCCPPLGGPPPASADASRPAARLQG